MLRKAYILNKLYTTVCDNKNLSNITYLNYDNKNYYINTYTKCKKNCNISKNQHQPC